MSEDKGFGCYSDQSYNYQPVTADIDGKKVVVGAAIETSHDIVLYQDLAPTTLAGTFPVPKDADLYVYGDIVQINGRIEAKGRKVRIVCRSLQTSGAAAIVVDGNDGAAPANKLPKPPAGKKGSEGYSGKEPFTTIPRVSGGTGEKGPDGSNGDDGKSGQKGGTIEIFCQEIAENANFNLTLSANGGKGGASQAGQDAGDGGPGGDGKSQEDGFGYTEHATDGGKGGQGGDGGKGGRGGKGGDGGTVTVTVVQEKKIEIKISVEPGGGGQPGDGGQAGNGGAPGTGGEYPTWKFGPHGEKIHYKARKGNGGSGADGKTLGKGDAAPGDTKRGTQTITFSASYKDIAKRIRPSQFQMLFHKARTAFLAAGEASSDSALKYAQTLLSYLHSVLKETATDEKEDAKRYDEKFCRALLSRVDALLGNIFCGYNYFGKDERYAPRQSLAAYEDWLTQSLASLEKFEKTRKAYFAALKEKTAAKDHLTNVAAMVGGQISFYQDLQRQAGDAIATCVDAIGSAQTLVEEAKAAFDEELKKYEAAVKKAFALESLAQLLGILETLSFTPHDAGWQKNAMLVSQGGKLLSTLSGMGGDLETSSGSYKKEYVIHQIDVFGEQIKSLKEAYTISYDRSVALQDPNAYKLLMKRDKFEELCNTFYSKEGVDSTKAREAMDHLVEQVQLRNDKIMEYNGLLRQQQDLRSRLDSLDLQRRETETKLTANADPGLPEMTAFVDDCYEQAKERCLKDLYMASRAYVFWSLEPYSLFEDLLEKTHPNEVDYTLMLRGKDTILAKLREARERIARPPQSFTKVVIHLKDHPGALQTLRSKEMANFYIQPARKDTTRDASPFAGLADVRITKVRPWAIGLQTGESDHKAHLHHIVMTHLGSETLITPVDEACSFVHEQVDTTVIYDSAAIGKDKAFVKSQGESEDGTLEDPEGRADFSQIGPFGKWRISILKKHNIGLKLDTLQDVEIEFYGRNSTLR